MGREWSTNWQKRGSNWLKQKQATRGIALGVLTFWKGMLNRLFMAITLLKPWPNRVASRRKLKNTWVHLRLRLTRPCVHLRCLAMTFARFGWDEIRTQVNELQSKFFIVWPPKSSQRKLSDVHQHIITQIRGWSALKCFFLFTLRLACTCEESWESVWPPNASLGQVELASTCDYMPVLSARA